MNGGEISRTLNKFILAIITGPIYANSFEARSRVSSRFRGEQNKNHDSHHQRAAKTIIIQNDHLPRPTDHGIHPSGRISPKDPEDFPIMLCAHTIISRFLLANFHAPHHHQHQWAWNAVQRMMKMRGGGGGCMNWRFFAPTKN